MSNPTRSQYLVQTPCTRSLCPPRLLTVTQLCVEAPYCNDKNYVTDGPEKTEEAKPWDHQIPQLQVTQLWKTRNKRVIYHSLKIASIPIDLLQSLF